MARAHGVVDEVRVPIISDADTVIARQEGRTAALRIGLSRTDATFVATAISEIGRNITVHAGQGEIMIRRVTEGGRTGIVVIAQDHGPGISDVDAVMHRDYSSDAGLGMGLWGAQRLMDEVVVKSEPGVGTTVTMTKWCGADQVGVLLNER
jgi:anti-sigma regulatory factor (Ser/Thr protein kinase)